jgi:hypothetical protein
MKDFALQFVLWRQDDNGNRFQVGIFASQESARLRLEELTRVSHRQIYWIERVEEPRQ